MEDSERAGTAIANRPRPAWMIIRVCLVEALLVSGLLSGYQVVRFLAAGDPAHAVRNAEWVWWLERALHMPNEVALQHWVLEWPRIVWAANVYYVSAHFSVIALVLTWLFVWFRQQYRRMRNELGVLTGASLLTQLAFPLAPPRLMPQFGAIDTAQTLGPSAYPEGQGGSRISSRRCRRCMSGGRCWRRWR